MYTHEGEGWLLSMDEYCTDVLSRRPWRHVRDRSHLRWSSTRSNNWEVCICTYMPLTKSI